MDWLSLALGFTALISTVVIAVVSTRQLRSVSRHLDLKISNIEELTRKPLTDFPSVFRFAEQIIDDLTLAEQDSKHNTDFPDDFLWILNYTPCLGRVHSYNVEYTQDTRFHDDPIAKHMAVRALAFTAKVEGLSKLSSDFRLVTVEPKEIESLFLRPILGKLQFSGDLDHIIADVGQHHCRAIQNILGNLESRGSTRNLRFVSDVPTQMFLARIRGESRCLVFSTMGNSERTKTPNRHHVRGFYTQLEPICEFYRDRYVEVFDSARSLEQIGYCGDVSLLGFLSSSRAIGNA